MTEYNRVGALVSDEAIACTESVSIGGGTYYRGRAAQMAARSVLGSTSPTYGAWTATSKGGTRLDVVQDPGVPADATELGWDLVAGWVYSTTSRTVYVYYLGHGSFVAPARERFGGMFPGVVEVTGSGAESTYQVGRAGYGATIKELKINRAGPWGSTGATAVRLSVAGVGEASAYLEASVAMSGYAGSAGAGTLAISGVTTITAYIATAGGHQDVEWSAVVE